MVDTVTVDGTTDVTVQQIEEVIKPFISEIILGGGDVIGPSSAINNALAKFNSTSGKVIADSGIFVDTGKLGIGTETPGSNLEIADTTPVMALNTDDGAGNPQLNFEDQGTVEASIRYDFATGDIVFYQLISAVWTEKFRLKAAGLATLDGQTVSRRGVSVTEVFSMDDFPAPVAGVITLPSGKYSIRATITTADRFVIAIGATVTFEVEDSRSNIFTYTGTGTLFTAVNAVRIAIQDLNLICTAAGSQVFDITGGNFAIGTGQLRVSGANATIGTITDGEVILIRNMTILDYTYGITLNGFAILVVDEIYIADVVGSSGALFRILNYINLYASFAVIVAVTQTLESVFFVDPVIGSLSAGNVEIDHVTNIGAGDFFETGDTGPIASFTDVSVSAVAVSVSDNSGQALFTEVAHGLVIGETADHTTFTQSTYNGSHIVTVASANTYEVGLAYVADDSGLLATTTTQVNDVAHGRSEGDTLSIFGTINFNKGYRIFNVLTDSFEITLGKAFPGTETGTWDTGSLTERSIYIDARDNGDQKESKNLIFVHMNANTVATTIALVDTYQAIDLTGLVQDDSTELWTLIDPIAGVMRYDGHAPFIGSMFMTISAVKTGVLKNYRFAVSVDGAIPVFATAFYAPMEVKTTKVTIPAVKPVSIVSGQTIQLMIAGDGTTDAITITDIILNLSQ